MLQIEQLNAMRGQAHVLRDVSLDVGIDEVVCVVGRNGAGKTTLIENVMGLLRSSSGQVRLGSAEITNLPSNRIARLGVGYAPDNSGIFPRLTVDENIRISEWVAESAARRPKAAQGKPEDLFPEIADFRDRAGANLSGGQKKMVALTRALALNPSLLLLDEAFEGLAPIIVERFTHAVAQIKKLGISVLMAESNLHAASRIADRVYVLDRGEILFEGTPDEVQANAKIMQVIHA
jgi:branched-chain amino acid transport system ATP-binding protein